MLDLRAHRADALPAALADLYDRTVVGDRTTLQFARALDPRVLDDVVDGGGFRRVGGPRAHTVVERVRSLPDRVAPGMRVLLCGLNPSCYSADLGIDFARPGNRFWPAALAAGLVTRDRDPQHALTAHGIGRTDLVKRATARADELAPDELVAGAARVARLCALVVPRVLCVVGISGWRTAVDRKATIGVQPARIGRTIVYVMHNPSGLNAHARVEDLARHLRTAAALADAP